MRFLDSETSKALQRLEEAGVTVIRWTTLMSGWQHRSHFMMRQKKNMDGLMAL